MVDDHPWEPPIAGTEAEHLIGALERQRATFRWKADGLDSAGPQTRIGASSLTLGGLLKHLARTDAQRFGPNLDGEPMAVGGGCSRAPLGSADHSESRQRLACGVEQAHICGATPLIEPTSSAPYRFQRRPPALGAMALNSRDGTACLER